MILRYTDRSKDDVELAFAWYEKQRRGLGFDFLDSVEMSLNNILAFPEGLGSDYRKTLKFSE